MIELNKTYTQKELAAALGVNYGTFKNNKDVYLNQLDAAFEYTVEYKGRGQYYTFTSVIEDYESPARINAKAKTDELLLKFILYITEGGEVINTAANEARIALQTETDDEMFAAVRKLAMDKKNPERYLYNKLLPLDHLAFGKNVGEEGCLGRTISKVWCRLGEDNYYIPLEENMIKEYFNYVDEAEKAQKKSDADIFEDYNRGAISREVMIERLGENRYNMFAESKRRFRDKYGFTPVKVPVRELSAWAQEKKVTGFTKEELRNLVAALSK